MPGTACTSVGKAFCNAVIIMLAFARDYWNKLEKGLLVRTTQNSS